MPSIQVFPDVVRAYNRVEINWADLPQVTQARVLRVDAVTGVCTPLRPYICFDGDHLLLSCGHGIFWDTEVPLDRSVYYITEGIEAPCIPDPIEPIVSDSFTRVVVNDWGMADTGQDYGFESGPLSQYDVTGTEGTITPDTLGANRYIQLDCGLSNYIAQITLTTNTIPTGAGGIGAYGLTTRWVDDNNYIRMVASIAPTSGDTTLFITRVVAGVASVSSVPSPFPLSTADLNIKVSVIGAELKIKAWQVATPEPSGWNLEVTGVGISLTSTIVGAIARRDAGNVTPTILAFDNFLITSDCSTCTSVTTDTSSTPTTMPSNGAFRLRDPVRPCNDIYMPLCFEQVTLANQGGNYCVPGSGVFFASMDTETYAANSILVNPTNAKYPISVNRTRRATQSTLEVVTRTFDDRDKLLRLNEPGSPLLIQGPPQYGIPDRYMAVSTVAVDRGLTDHKFQTRIINMPFTEVARPSGPTQGVCGSQVASFCDYTWQELVDMGFTWEDLIRGRGGEGGVIGDYRTWDDVLAEFADWDDVNNGTRTWYDLEVGD